MQKRRRRSEGCEDPGFFFRTELPLHGTYSRKETFLTYKKKSGAAVGERRLSGRDRNASSASSPLATARRALVLRGPQAQAQAQAQHNELVRPKEGN